MFDEEPDDDIHGRCAAEIKLLEGQIEILKAQKQALYPFKDAVDSFMDGLERGECPDTRPLRLARKTYEQHLKDGK